MFSDWLQAAAPYVAVLFFLSVVTMMACAFRKPPPPEGSGLA